MVQLTKDTVLCQYLVDRTFRYRDLARVVMVQTTLLSGRGAAVSRWEATALSTKDHVRPHSHTSVGQQRSSWRRSPLSSLDPGRPLPSPHKPSLQPVKMVRGTTRQCRRSQSRRSVLLGLASVWGRPCSAVAMLCGQGKILGCHLPPSSRLVSLLNCHSRHTSQNKFLVVAALFASASAFAPSPAFKATSALANNKADWEAAAELGWSMGGEDYSRNPEVQEHEDARKSIHEAPSFEEYMKQRAQQG